MSHVARAVCFVSGVDVAGTFGEATAWLAEQIPQFAGVSRENVLRMPPCAAVAEPGRPVSREISVGRRASGYSEQIW